MEHPAACNPCLDELADKQTQMLQRLTADPVILSDGRWQNPLPGMHIYRPLGLVGVQALTLHSQIRCGSISGLLRATNHFGFSLCQKNDLTRRHNGARLGMQGLADKDQSGQDGGGAEALQVGPWPLGPSHR